MAITSLATSAQALVNLTAETASPTSAPGVSVIAFAEAAAKHKVADMQVTTGQTLTNSVQNVAEGKSDIAAAPFVLPFLMSRGVGPYAKLGKDAGAALTSNLAVLYTYRIACQGLYAYDSANFPGYDGIKNATIYNGPPRGAALTNARDLNASGHRFERKRLHWCSSKLGPGSKNYPRRLRGCFRASNELPDARMTATMSSGDMTIWSMPIKAFDGEKFQKFTKRPGTVAVSPNFRNGMEIRGYCEFRGRAIPLPRHSRWRDCEHLHDFRYGKSFNKGFSRQPR